MEIEGVFIPWIDVNSTNYAVLHETVPYSNDDCGYEIMKETSYNSLDYSPGNASSFGSFEMVIEKVSSYASADSLDRAIDKVTSYGSFDFPAFSIS